MTEPTPDAAELTAAAVAAAYPGLRQVEPYSIGTPLYAVEMAANRTARYTWAGYDVHVKVGPEEHLNREDPDDTSLQREVRAYATLLIPIPGSWMEGEVHGHVEWTMRNPRPEIVFPAAYNAAAADMSDPRLASAVLATVAQALDYTWRATAHAGHQAAEAAEQARWERERPPGVPRSKWLREKRAARDARRAAPGAHTPDTTPETP